MVGLVRRTPRERSDQPLPGYKLAFPVLSADGATTAFSGVTVGRSHVYGSAAVARCIYSLRHDSPSGWCDCGFYCFQNVSDAWELASEPDYRQTVLLEITAAGRYLRYEKGLRYAKQQVLAMRTGRCLCGRAVRALVDTGAEHVDGWRRLMPACPACVGSYPALTPAVFGRLAGGVEVIVEEEPAGSYLTQLPAADLDAGTLVPLLAAEVALLQARLDEVQARLERLTRTP